MEENTVMTNETEVEVLDNVDDVSDVSSGNPINVGIAAAGAALIGGLITAGVIISKKIKAKKEKANADAPAEKKPKKREKGIPFGKGKRLQVVEIDQRTNPEENPTNEEE